MTGGNNNVEKCVNCEYYDRRRARPTDGKAPMWGQCRRHSPLLNPATAKAYVVEGAWPLVRDDDWCGEWKILTRMLEELTTGRACGRRRGRQPIARPNGACNRQRGGDGRCRRRLSDLQQRPPRPFAGGNTESQP